MTEEDKKAIEYFTKRIDICNENANICDENDFDEEATQLREEKRQTEIILNLIKSQQKEIFVKEHINESFKLMINERDKKIVEMSNCIDKLKSKNKELLKKLRNRVKEVKKLTKYSLYKKEFSRLNRELEKKNKIIDLILQDLMVCGGLDFIDIGKSNGNFKEDKQKLKQYFEKKVEGKQC